MLGENTLLPMVVALRLGGDGPRERRERVEPREAAGHHSVCVLCVRLVLSWFQFLFS